LPTWLFALPIMPQWVRNIGIVKQRFEILTKEMLENERRGAATRPAERKSLMSTLVALSDAEKDHSGSLTEEQISGNLFLFTVLAMKLQPILLLMASQPSPLSQSGNSGSSPSCNQPLHPTAPLT
jgi:hypothetical protein